MSAVRFKGVHAAAWSEPQRVSVNEPVEHDGLWYFQAQWDPPDMRQAEDGTETPSAQPPEEPSFIDLDQNGEADLCQLRRGDLDLDGTINEGDLALLLTMLGEAPVMGFGDLNDDGVIDSTDVAELTARQVPAEPVTR
jgi:hypothetical protein